MPFLSDLFNCYGDPDLWQRRSWTYSCAKMRRLLFIILS